MQQKEVLIPNLNIVYKACRETMDFDDPLVRSVKKFFNTENWSNFAVPMNEGDFLITKDENNVGKEKIKVKLLWKPLKEKKEAKIQEGSESEKEMQAQEKEIGTIEFSFDAADPKPHVQAVCSNPVVVDLIKNSSLQESPLTLTPTQTEFAVALNQLNARMDKLKTQKPSLFIKVETDKLLFKNWLGNSYILKKLLPNDLSEEQKCVAVICALLEHLWRFDSRYRDNGLQAWIKIINQLSEILENYSRNEKPNKTQIAKLREAADQLPDAGSKLGRKWGTGLLIVSATVFVPSLIVYILLLTVISAAVLAANPVFALAFVGLGLGIMGIVGGDFMRFFSKPTGTAAWTNSLADMLEKSAEEPELITPNLDSSQRSTISPNVSQTPTSNLGFPQESFSFSDQSKDEKQISKTTDSNLSKKNN